MTKTMVKSVYSDTVYMERELNKAIANLEREGHEIINITSMCVHTCYICLILYRVDKEENGNDKS